MTDWLTTSEAATLLGLSPYAGGTLDALRKAGVEERKVNGYGSKSVPRVRCLWRRDQVEAVARERNLIGWMEAHGFKFCVGCQEWKDKATEFAPTAHRCRKCKTEENKAAWAEKKKRRHTFANTNPDVSDGPDDWRVGQPPKPGDALQYSCLDIGYHHRPIPRGTTKRKAFCRACHGLHCYFHAHLTPRQVVKGWASRHRVAEYADG